MGTHPPTPAGPSHRTGGHYQDFIPDSDYPLYFLNPLQEFLEGGFRGGVSKQAPEHTLTQGRRRETCGSWSNRRQTEGR